MTLTLDAFTGLALIGAGLCLLMREILLSPGNRTFPCAPLAVRAAMFAVGVALLVIGVLFFRPRGPSFAGDAAVPIAVLAAVVLAYNAILLGNIFRERRPAKVWAAKGRIDRASGFAR